MSKELDMVETLDMCPAAESLCCRLDRSRMHCTCIHTLYVCRLSQQCMRKHCRNILNHSKDAAVLASRSAQAILGRESQLSHFAWSDFHVEKEMPKEADVWKP